MAQSNFLSCWSKDVKYAATSGLKGTDRKSALLVLMKMLPYKSCFTLHYSKTQLCTWFLTGVTYPLSLQSTVSGSSNFTFGDR